MTTKVLSKEEVDLLISEAEAEIQRLNEIEQECQLSGKPPDRMISFDQHVENTAQLYGILFTLRASRAEIDTLKESMQSFVEHHEAETKGLESRIAEADKQMHDLRLRLAEYEPDGVESESVIRSIQRSP